MSKHTYYLVNKLQNRVVLETEYDFMVLSGDMNYLNKEVLDEMPRECKFYTSYLRVKMVAWLYDLKVVKQDELVEIIFSFKKKYLK